MPKPSLIPFGASLRFLRKLALNLNKALIVWPFPTCFRRLAEWMNRTLAPLRKIVSRSIEVLEYDRIHKERPHSFIVRDHLECGHEFACLDWDLFDLLLAYTPNPDVSAKRHRCRPCARLLAQPKPVQSVSAYVKRAGVA